MFRSIARQIERGMRPHVTLSSSEAITAIEALRTHGGDRQKALAAAISKRLVR